MANNTKPSGIDWIGDIPAGWDIKKLRYATKLRTESGYFSEGDIYIGLENIESSTGKYIQTETGYNEDFYDIVRKGDVLFGKLRPYLEKVYVSDIDGFCTGEFLNIKEFEGNKRYLFYFLLSHGFIEIVNSSTYGAKMPRAEWDFIKNLQITLPSLKEQQATAAFLDVQCKTIDGIITEMEQQIEVLKQYKTALITETVTKGLDKTAPMKDSGIDWIGKIPAHWEVTKVKYTGLLRYGLGEPPLLNETGLPIIRATNIKRGKIIEDGLVYALKEDIPKGKDVILKQGDIIIVRSGAYAGDAAIIPEKWEGSLGGYDIIFTPNKIYPVFAMYSFLSLYILNYQLLLLRSRAAQPHLNTIDIGNLVILFPPVYEQEKIAEYVDDNISRIDIVISEKLQSIETMRAYKKSLIYEYVTGKKRVKGAK
jgi:type I restriction enzyme S subunit